MADLLRTVVRSVSVKKQRDVSLRYSKLQATRSASCYVSRPSSQPAMSDLVPTFIGRPISRHGEVQPSAETTGDLSIVAHSHSNLGNVMLNASPADDMPHNSDQEEEVVRGYDRKTSCMAAQYMVHFHGYNKLIYA